MAGTPRRTAVTMADVAAAAGLDRSTVSRALQGRSDRVNEQTILHVRETAQRLGYLPDVVAATLRGGRSRMVGVLVPTIRDAAMAALFDGIEQESRAAGYLAVVASTSADPQIRQTAVAGYLGRRVDALILADSLFGQSLPAAGDVPMVMALRRWDDHLGVTADDISGGAQVAHHLLERGHRQLAVLGDRSLIPSIRDRVDGFRDAVAASGTGATCVELPAGLQVDDGFLAMREFLTRGSAVSAVFAVNDYSAIGAASAIQQTGLELGRDIALVGYNDDPVTARLHTPLSTVHNDLLEVGRTAVRLALARLDGGRPESVRIPPALVIRESSAAQHRPV